jgi:hypothetical protein
MIGGRSGHHVDDCGGVVGVVAVAVDASYEHTYALVQACSAGTSGMRGT